MTPAKTTTPFSLAFLGALALATTASAKPEPVAVTLASFEASSAQAAALQVPQIELDAVASQVACLIPLDADEPKLVLTQAGSIALTSCPIPN